MFLRLIMFILIVTMMSCSTKQAPHYKTNHPDFIKEMGSRFD
jgi:hypothetical protein